jgi:hypothetical protein
MHVVIPLLHLMKEAHEQGLLINVKNSAIHCKIFEDNSGALEMARAPKMHPCTKHINIKCHHFLEHVTYGLLSLYAVSTDEQIADIFTKPLSDIPFTNQ